MPGAGARIYAALEAAASAAQIDFVFVEINKAVRRLFERNGFEVERRRDFAVDGLAVHNYRKTKRLV